MIQMRTLVASALALGIAAAVVPPLAAQQVLPGRQPQPETLTPEQAKVIKEEFLRTHEFDPKTDTWQLKKGATSTYGVVANDQILAAKKQFLETHAWNEACKCWKQVGATKKAPLTRKQMGAEAAAFSKTHYWDDAASMWKERPTSNK